MPIAFVLINCSHGQETKIIDNLKTTYGVKEIQHTVGFYDILTKIESKTHKELEIIKEKIHKLEKVRATQTLMGKETS